MCDEECIARRRGESIARIARECGCKASEVLKLLSTPGARGSRRSDTSLPLLTRVAREHGAPVAERVLLELARRDPELAVLASYAVPVPPRVERAVRRLVGEF